jgi:hypothetical protein
MISDAYSDTFTWISILTMDSSCLKLTRNSGDSSYFNCAETHPNFGLVLQENKELWAVRVSNPRHPRCKRGALPLS